MADAVVHFEVPYDDQDRAAAFYGDVFGWHVRHMPELAYVTVATGETDGAGMPTAPGYIGGGMFPRSDEVDRTVVTIAVADVHAALERVAGSGGATVVAPMPVGDMGWAAYFTDSEGNLMGLWQDAGS